MHYFDPQRPKAGNGLPQYVGPDGRPIAVIPHVYVALHQHPDGKTFPVLTCFLMTGGNGASDHRAALNDLSELQAFFEAYLADPEATLTTYFKYQGKTPTISKVLAQSKSEILKDLSELFDE